LVEIFNKISGGSLDSIITKFKDGTKDIGEVMGDIKVDFETIDKMAEENIMKKLYSPSKGYSGSGGLASDLVDTSDKAKEMAEAFRDTSKTIVDAIDDQRKAISDLRKEMTSLNDDFKSDSEEINKRYEKLISKEETAKGLGFRSRIQELQQDKADEIAKLQKKYDKEALALSGEETSRLSFLSGLESTATSPSALSKASSERLTFLGSIGQAQTQQQIIFNFNGDVSDIDTLKSKIISALNREAQLLGVGGK
jgi:hypothetical protein